MPAAPRRLAELDAMRGIAAVLVVLHHANYAFMAEYGSVAIWLLEWTPLRVLKDGRAPVIFFFVLSGYVLTLALLRAERINPLTWAAQRTARLLPPVAAATAFSILAYWAVAQPVPPVDLGALVEDGWIAPPDFRTAMAHVLLLGSDGAFHLNIVLWSLVHEWRISLVLPAVLLFRGKVALLLATTFLLRTAAISAGASDNNVLLGPQLHSTLPATAYFAFAFAAGAALAMEGPRGPLLGPNRWAAWAVVIAASVPDSDLAVVVASVLLILLAQGGGVFPALLRHPVPLWLGRISYSLYLIHVPVMLATAHALHGSLGPLPITAVGVLLAFPLAWVLYITAERPALALSRLIGTCRIRPATTTSQAPAGS
jgi:peptidoglycan/LPS O-acetylase OafA/YrhL